MITILDDWVNGKPDAWDYEAVLREYSVVVEWCNMLIDSNGKEHHTDSFAGWSFLWKHGTIYIGKIPEVIARKAAALFVSLWLRNVSASFCNKLMQGYIIVLDLEGAN